jgi:acetoin utilization deacetylase AcuC-like enzyme
MATVEPLTVLLLTDPAGDAHAWPGHPERPERLPAVVEGVREGAAAAGATLVEAAAPPASVEMAAAVHDASYLGWLVGTDETGFLDADTYVVPGSGRAALAAAGLAVAAARAVALGEATVAFSVARPPGHHAHRGGGKGFCLLNNVVVAAGALRQEGLARRIAILDWDVHHGDGTESMLTGDPDALYASTHQYPWYPGTGPTFRSDTVLDVPLAAGSGDGELQRAWTEDILPAVEAFRPEAILVSAGYDAHAADPLAGLEVTAEGFGAVARAVGETAAKLGLSGVALALEGGYDLPALRASSAATVTGLVGGLAGPLERDART